MSLTNPVLPWMLGILSLLLFALIVLGLPGWRDHRARAANRAVQAVLLNLLVLATVGAILNNQYVLYSSWSDLLGMRGHVSVGHQGASADAAERVRAAGAGLGDVGGPRDYALPQAGLRLQHYRVRDTASGLDMDVLVRLPSGYDPNATTTYPVILGLHGWPGKPANFTKINFISTIDRLTAEGTLRPSIVVIPQINNPDATDTECVNGPPGSPQTETWLSQEMPDWIVRHFHVATDRQSWATLGYSFGGWCAALMTMRHPGVFGAAISFAGYFEPDFASSYKPLTPAEIPEYDLVRMMRTSPPPVAIWLFASHQDPIAFPSSQRFYEAARAPASVKATFVQVGGHRHQVYEPYTADALTWLARSLPGFRA